MKVDRCLVMRVQHGAGVAVGDRVAQLVRFFRPRANDAAMLALVILGPIESVRQLAARS